MRVRLCDGHPSDEPTEVAGRIYHPPPDIDARPGAYDLLQCDMDLGDCIFFDLRTLHGGLSTVAPKQTERRFTLRMTALDGGIMQRIFGFLYFLDGSAAVRFGHTNWQDAKLR